MPDHSAVADTSFINRCEQHIYHDGIDLDEVDRLRLFRLAGHACTPPNHRAAWPPYANMIEDAKQRVASNDAAS